MATEKKPDPRLKALGAAFRAAREAQAISQEELSARAGVDRAYTGRFENGARNATLLTALKLADGLRKGDDAVRLSKILRKAGL